MGKANIEARPKPPRKIVRREGLLKALSRTCWKCSLLDWLSMGSNELDIVGSVVKNLIVNSCCYVYVTNKVAEKKLRFYVVAFPPELVGAHFLIWVRAELIGAAN
jgi:hypothetical protein